MALGASFGLFGLFLGVIVIVLRLCVLRSFGVPYMSTFAPLRLKEQRDTLFRVPFAFMKKRPTNIQSRNVVRQK